MAFPPSFPSSRWGTRLSAKLCFDARGTKQSFGDTGIPKPELGNEEGRVSGAAILPTLNGFAVLLE